MNPSTSPLFRRLWAPLAFAAVAGAGAARADEPPAASMLTMAQAVTIAEVTQAGTAFDMKRTTAGTEVVYRVRVSTADRGTVEVQIAAYGGRVETRTRERQRVPA